MEETAANRFLGMRSHLKMLRIMPATMLIRKRSRRIIATTFLFI